MLARQALNYAACSDLNCFLLHLVLLVEMFVVLRLRQFDVSSHVPYSKSSPRFTPHLLIKGSRDHNIWSLQKDLLRCLSSLPKWRWCSPKDASVGRYEYRYSAQSSTSPAALPLSRRIQSLPLPLARGFSQSTLFIPSTAGSQSLISHSYTCAALHSPNLTQTLHNIPTNSTFTLYIQLRHSITLASSSP